MCSSGYALYYITLGKELWVHKNTSDHNTGVYMEMNIKSEARGKSFLICGGVIDIYGREDILLLVDEQRKICCRRLGKDGNFQIRALPVDIKKFLGWDQKCIMYYIDHDDDVCVYNMEARYGDCIFSNVIDARIIGDNWVYIQKGES